MGPRCRLHPSRRGENAAPQDEGIRLARMVMTTTSAFFETPGDASRAAELKRVKL
jgi:hypothetical protein